VVVVLCIGGVLSVVWSVSYYRRAWTIVHRPVKDVPAAAVPARAVHRRAVGSAVQTDVLVAEPDLDPSSTRAANSGVITSSLVFDDVVLVGYEQSDKPVETLVLLLGSDARAQTALTILDLWQTHQAEVRLRPFKPGSVELQDGRDNSIRARVLS
jgi:hypothetical protein